MPIVVGLKGEHDIMGDHETTAVLLSEMTISPSNTSAG